MLAQPLRRLLLVIGTGWSAEIKSLDMLGSGFDVPANGMRRDANVVIQIDDEFVGELRNSTIEGPRLARRRLEKILGMQSRVGLSHDSFGAKLLAIFHDERCRVCGRDVARCERRKRPLQ